MSEKDLPENLTYFPDFHDAVIGSVCPETFWDCPDCDGSGTVIVESGSPLDIEPTQSDETCDLCNGTGVI